MQAANSGGQPSAPSSFQKTKSNQTLIWSLVGAGILLVLAIAYMLLVWLPNKPGNVYRKGLDSVGTGLQYLITEEFLEGIASTSYSGNLTINTTSIVDADIKFEGEYDTQNATFNITSDINSSEIESPISIVLDGRYLGPQANSAPVLYFRLDDLTIPGEEGDAITDLLDLGDLTDTWWKMDFQELVDQGLITNEDLESLSFNNETGQDDYEEVALVFINALQEYIFTSVTEKMVFGMDQALGQETFEGTETQKYSTTVNKANFQALIVQMRDGLAESEMWKKLNADSDIVLSEEISDEDIEEMVDNFIKDTEVEIWVDSQSKVLRNMRFRKKDTKSFDYGSYVDFGVILEDEITTISIQSTNYSAGACENIDKFHERVSDQPRIFLGGDECPYEYEEYIDQDCGEAPEMFDTLTRKSVDIEAMEEYRRCEAPTVQSLKDDASPEGTVNITLKVDTANKKIEYELSFETEGLKIQLTLEATGQEEVANVQAPEDSKSIFDLEILQQLPPPIPGVPSGIPGLQQNSRNVQRRGDIAWMRANLDTYISNNNGRSPEDVNTFSEVLVNTTFEHYDNDSNPNNAVTAESASVLSASTTRKGVIYDVLGNDDTPSAPTANDAIGVNEVHVWVGRSCVNDVIPNARYTGAATEVAKAASTRFIAFVYHLEGEADASCMDNF